MDYKQKYKEALEKAREQYNYPTMQSSMGILEEIFPELVESEDERIRKWIRKELESKYVVDNIVNNVMADKALAWLEKQSTPQVRTGLEWVNTIDDACDKRYSEEYAHGEYCHEQSFKWGFQEGVDWLEKQGESYTKMDVDDAYLKGVTDAKREIEKQYEANYQIRKDIATFIFNYRGDIKDRAKWMDYLGIKVSFIKKQGEQKPVDVRTTGYWHVEDVEQKPTGWSEKLIADVFEMVGLAKIVREQENDALTRALQSAMIELAKYSVVPQTRKEWSEEDAIYIENIILAVEKQYPIAAKELTSWLKSLKDRVLPQSKQVLDFLNKLRTPKDRVQPQPKQEWSEEDKDFMYDTLSNLTELKDRYGEGYGNVGKCIDWFKSLKERYIWKPSEEQIEALLKLEEMHVLEHEKNQENAHLYMVVKSIREQLLKLREE